MSASVLVFLIACSNVANLILARTVYREGELGMRAALGATSVDLRRNLLAESLLLCVSGATLGIFIAGQMVTVLARYASRYFSACSGPHGGFEHAVVGSGIGGGCRSTTGIRSAPAIVGRRPGLRLGIGSPRMTGTTNRKLKVFALVQIAASFVLVAAPPQL
jgi:ABC-type antimicrobial peptide transport system permease subunit